MQTIEEHREYRVIGAHSGGTFFSRSVTAVDGLSAFGVAARQLHDEGVDGAAEFFVAIPGDAEIEFPGEGVVCLETVLDPEQAEVFRLAPREQYPVQRG